MKAGGAGLRLRGERLPAARKGGRAARAAKLSPPRGPPGIEGAEPLASPWVIPRVGWLRTSNGS